MDPSCHLKIGEFPIAKNRFLELVNSSCSGQEKVLSLLNLASCYRSLKQIDSAFYYYDAAITVFPSYAGGYFNKAQLFRSFGRFEESKELFDRAIVLDSTDWIMYMKRQEVAFILQRYDEALGDMLKARSLKPDLKIEFNMAYCIFYARKVSRS